MTKAKIGFLASNWESWDGNQPYRQMGWENERTLPEGNERL